MSARQSLGRGFDTLIPQELDRSILRDDEGRIQNLLITDIKPNPAQPRRQFDAKALNELAVSIKKHGVMQPIVVVKLGGSSYRIVAGERRWRAAGAAKLQNIPAIVRSLEELEQLELSLIENIQRVDLSPLEQAMAVYKLQQQFNLSLDEISQKLGKAVSTVSNLSRLLQLPDAARQALEAGTISEGHARAILSLKSNTARQDELLSCILSNKWTVRQAEAFVLKLKSDSRGDQTAVDKEIIDGLSAKLNSPVKIKHTAKGGQLIITFTSSEDLKRVKELLTR